MNQKRKIIVASMLGNVIEYYGFTVFAVFAAQIGKVFFPSTTSDYLTTLYALMLFGAGFITRPIGSIVFGHFGDKIGRKKTLSYTILGMSIATFIIGVVPGYDKLGILSPICIVILRLLQGFFVGGEGPGAALYMLEHNKNQKEGKIGGIVIASIVIGAFFATLIGFLLSYFLTINDFNWRFSFFIGGFAGIVGLYLRFSLPETADFVNIQNQNKILKIPIIQVLKNYWKNMIVIASLGGITTAISYMIMGYLITYLKQQLHFEQSDAMLYSMYSVFMYIVFLILIGNVLDKFKFKNFILLFSVLILFTSIFIFKAIASDNFVIFIIGLTLLPFLSAGVCAPAYPYVYKMFKAELRYSGVAVSYNLGITIFGGFAPAICTYLTKVTQLSYAPAFYLMFLALLYLFAEKILKVKQFDT